MRSESNAQGREARPGSSWVPSPFGIAHPERIAEVLHPSDFLAHPGSSRGPRLDGFTIHTRRADDLNVTPFGAHSLAARPGALTGSLSWFRGWRRIRTCSRPAPRPPASDRVPFRFGQPSSASRSAPRIRTEITRFLGPVALPVGLERLNRFLILRFPGRREFPLPALAIVSRSAHGGTSCSVPCSVCTVLGCLVPRLTRPLAPVLCLAATRKGLDSCSPRPILVTGSRRPGNY
jgi:hypothetical protein